MNRSYWAGSLSAPLGFLLQAAWLLMWPLPIGPFQPAASLAGPAVFLFAGVFTVWRWGQCGSLGPLVGGSLGTMLLWAIVLVRNDADEVGVLGAVMEGLLVGGLYAFLGGAPCLAVALWRSAADR